MLVYKIMVKFILATLAYGLIIPISHANVSQLDFDCDPASGKSSSITISATDKLKEVTFDFDLVSKSDGDTNQPAVFVTFNDSNGPALTVAIARQPLVIASGALPVGTKGGSRHILYSGRGGTDSPLDGVGGNISISPGKVRFVFSTDKMEIFYPQFLQIKESVPAKFTPVAVTSAEIGCGGGNYNFKDIKILAIVYFANTLKPFGWKPCEGSSLASASVHDKKFMIKSGTIKDRAIFTIQGYEAFIPRFFVLL